MSNNKCTEPLLIYQCQTINVQNHYLYMPMSNNKCTEPLLIYQCQTINVQNHYLYTNVKQ